MRIYGRDFRFQHIAKTLQLAGGSASPLLILAIKRRGALAGFEFSARASELYHEIVRDDWIPQSSLAEICGTQNGNRQIWIDLGQPSPEMPPGELALLCSLVKWKNPRIAVEIGTFKGFTTLHLSRNTAERCRIYTVDLPPTLEAHEASNFSDPQLIAASRSAQRAFESDPKVTQLFQDSTTVEWKRIVAGPIDFALIDGSHLYEHVRKDTENVMEALAPGALVMWHDYANVEVRRGVGRYLRELSTEGWPIWRLAGTSFCVYLHDGGEGRNDAPKALARGANAKRGGATSN
jgi:predicted O-methyltransferase YrrM